MNIALSLERARRLTVFYYPPVKNTVMENSNFVRLVHTDAHMALNSAFIEIPLHGVSADRHFNRARYLFSPGSNRGVIESVRALEESLLAGAGCPWASTQLRVSDQLASGALRIFSDCREGGYGNTKLFLLKISGIWVTDRDKGLTYKFSEGKNVALQSHQPSVEK